MIFFDNLSIAAKAIALRAIPFKPKGQVRMDAMSLTPAGAVTILPTHDPFHFHSCRPGRMHYLMPEAMAVVPFFVD